MQSSLLSAILLGAAAAVAAPAASTMSQCAAGMNNELPYSVPAGFKWTGVTRRYYIAAEVVQWDYAPSGWDNWLGVPMNESFRADTWGYIPSNETVGHGPFDKALYKAYTDSSFTEQVEQPAWAGYQGPIIRGEVGDMIEIMFVNKLDHFYASIHSMGLFYPKEYDGASYYNGTSNPALGDAVPPGDCFVYKWLVPSTAHPNTNEKSKIFAYHSFVSMYQDQDAGLSGPVIIYPTGQMETVMSENREFVVMYADNQESNSWLALQNVEKYLPGSYSQVANLSYEYPMVSSTANMSIWYPQYINHPLTNVTTTMLPNFFPINGYIYANNPSFEMCQNENVIWYVWNMGFDTHVFHWHGNNVVQTNGNVAGAVPINPGQMMTLTMTPASYGWWYLLCHFNTHLDKGMEANYMVYEADSCPLTPLKKAKTLPAIPGFP